MLKFICLLFLVAATATANKKMKSGKGNMEKNMEKCDFKTVSSIDEDFVEKGFKKGWNIPMLKDYKYDYNELDREAPEDKSTYKKTRCIVVSSTSEYGTMESEATCKYNNTILERCVLRNAGGIPFSPITAISMYGTLRLTMIEKTFYVIATCLFDTDPYWFVVSPHNVVEDGTKEKILDHLETLGFDREDVIADDSGKLRPHKFRQVDCKRGKNKKKLGDDLGVDV